MANEFSGFLRIHDEPFSNDYGHTVYEMILTGFIDVHNGLNLGHWDVSTETPDLLDIMEPLLPEMEYLSNYCDREINREAKKRFTLSVFIEEHQKGCDGFDIQKVIIEDFFSKRFDWIEELLEESKNTSEKKRPLESDDEDENAQKKTKTE